MPQDDSKMKTLQMTNAALLPEVIRMIDNGHTVTLPLRGYSMRPFLEDRRDKALLAAVDTPPAVGMPVLAEISPGRYVLHRIIRMDGDKVTLLGDGNINPEYCSLSDIKAVAVAFYRKGRTGPDRTDGRKWRLYSWFWTRLRPIRRYLLFIYRKLWTRNHN